MFYLDLLDTYVAFVLTKVCVFDSSLMRDLDSRSQACLSIVRGVIVVLCVVVEGGDDSVTSLRNVHRN